VKTVGETLGTVISRIIQIEKPELRSYGLGAENVGYVGY